MTEAIDCLYQTAPHIILYEPTKPRSHKDLYRQMVASERQILEQSRKRRCSTFPQAVAKRACRWYHDFTHKVDPEEDMALSLSDSVRSNHLAACYDVNASSSHLRDAIRAREMMKASFDARKRESEKSAPIISGNNNFQEGQKNGVTVTPTALLPSTGPSVTVATSPYSTHAPSHCSSYTEFRASIEKAEKDPSYHRPSWNPSFEQHSACERCCGKKTVLLNWGEGVDEEIEVPTRRWWQRLPIRRTWG
ncbi:MAG: hypothetical protein L6R39_004121 [Caloplaca ligustica]|nr:MAG: hypothetical protein L6R39_004121 [Caloplaca ligustica]